MSKAARLRIGFVGFGEVNTPREFIDERCQAVADELGRRGFDLVYSAPVSDDPQGEEARRAVQELEREPFAALVVCIAGWIPSWAVFQVIEPFRHKPILLWGQSGWRNPEGRFVTTADQAGSSALRLPMQEMQYNYKYLVNFKDEEPRFDEAEDWLRAALAAAKLQNCLIGMSGYRDMRLFGTLYNGNLLKGQLGVEIEHFDLLEISHNLENLDQAELQRLCAQVRQDWDFVREPQPGTIENSVRLYLAFRQKIEERQYAAFSYCDVDGVKKLLRFAPAGALTLLHQEMCLPTVPENDSYGAVTQLIMQYMSGQLCAYLEFYEFGRQYALMGVPDYVPANIVEGRIKVMPNAFGSFGEGLLNVSKLKGGEVTLARLAESGGAFIMHAATAQAVQPEAWEEAGWAPPAPQLPSLQMNFGKDVEPFLQEIMAQHYILSYGNNLGMLTEFCRIKNIELRVF
ncbi:MAG: hypothetical protein PHG44_05745 [Lentisphaeria bacterium]|nr:hypothetical protein [Lentisphaeria bacterium]MDY0175306.1 hypothetical protein [Lentisphaeria bacterium]NLZ60645.1 hypothetical protein [Lentisphaerota bacterium]